MAKWKLVRQTYGDKEYELNEGDEVSIGRGVNNTISLSSLVISRNHCVINVKRHELLITDLKSSNGVFVGTKKIPPNIPHVVKDLDIIGIGWTPNFPLGKVQDSEKYVFKAVKKQVPSLFTTRITFQSENELDDIEEQIASLEHNSRVHNLSPIIGYKPPQKRKNEESIIFFNQELNIKSENNIVITLSDSENEVFKKEPEEKIKKPKLEPVVEEVNIINDKNNINPKSENEDLQLEAFNVKQEYLGYDDEPIQLDSESDSESEHWFLRLSQSSPGKPFTKIPQNKIDNCEDSSYSQIDEDFCDNFSENEIDIVSIPLQPTVQNISKESAQIDAMNSQTNILSMQEITQKPIDDVDGSESVRKESKDTKFDTPAIEITATVPKKTVMIDAQVLLPRKKMQHVESVTKKTSKTQTKNDIKKKRSKSRHTISNSQKEERKKKLKDIAAKEKEDAETKASKTENVSKSASNIKITSSSRGAFLSDVVQIVKPMKRKESPIRSKQDVNKSSSSLKFQEPIKNDTMNDSINKKKHSTPNKDKSSSPRENIENKVSDKIEKKKHKSKHRHSHKKEKLDSKSPPKPVPETRAPLKSLKRLTDSEDSFAGKPFSKVEPLPPRKPKKSVHFSEKEPEVLYFQIQEGNQMKKTSLVRASFAEISQMPIYSLEKITMMKILRWNPHWLEEQINNNNPPPILGHSNPPLAVFHSFVNHNQYVQLIGDLLLMEIWECLSIAYMKLRNEPIKLQMRIASMPPVPTQERSLDLFNISVDVSVPTPEAKIIPRVGDLLLTSFGPENAQHQRFFFVHNVRCLPSPQSNKNVFYNISLHATFTERMRVLKPGAVLLASNLAYINKELSLFEAIAYMAGSPLSEAILKPDPRHFIKINNNFLINMNSQWTMTLNQSQQTAVKSSVSAALGDQPCLQMVQGPPGTGKSSVICAIVMTYFYDAMGQKFQNRGKILICATSNAAVDELVIRLLHIRQSLPKNERFRMVRVGRAESMHPRAFDVSSQQLAQRDAARLQQEPAQSGVEEEILRLEAKINMWKTAAQDAMGKDPMRVAYCEGRASEFAKRISLLQSGGGGGAVGVRPERLAAAERRIVEGADIVLTTLASAHNHKMRGLKRRIALCIIDEAGQAIEPEALIPLTLDVTKLTLIGDPQQLPGYICSQRAKKHGLGESLFSRLASCSESWGEEAVVLLQQQYRMQAAIAHYPNRAFYGGRVLSVPPPRPALPLPPYCVLAVASGDKGQNAAGGNEMESWAVSRVVVALSDVVRSRRLSLAVITPYNAHRDLVRRALRHLQPNEPPVEVNTVDSFQGQERDVILVSLARSHGVGFLTDTGRMNVMLTRARHALIICLNPQAVLKNHQWRTLLEDAQQRNVFKTLPLKMCQANSSISNEEILKHISS